MYLFNINGIIIRQLSFGLQNGKRKIVGVLETILDSIAGLSGIVFFLLCKGIEDVGI